MYQNIGNFSINWWSFFCVVSRGPRANEQCTGYLNYQGLPEVHSDEDKILKLHFDTKYWGLEVQGTFSNIRRKYWCFKTTSNGRTVCLNIKLYHIFYIDFTFCGGWIAKVGYSSNKALSLVEIREKKNMEKFLNKMICLRFNPDMIKLIFFHPWLHHTPWNIMSLNCLGFVRSRTYVWVCLKVLHTKDLEILAYRNSEHRIVWRGKFFGLLL